MPRKVRVLTTSTYVHEATRSVADYRQMACDFVEAGGTEGADLVCLPENFLCQGVPREQRPVTEPEFGPTVEAVASIARKHRLWAIVPLCVRDESTNNEIYNSAVVINRDGEVAGRYAKVHPTEGECIERCIVPGSDPFVIDTDFGRLGLAICYDIGWPDYWTKLGQAGAELVVWPSAYDGGFPLQAYAWSNSYYVVTSVRSLHSKVIDITGQILTSTSRWHRLAATTIDLEKELFHTDKHEEKILKVQQEMGRRVDIRAYSEENFFTLESNDPDWPVARIKDHYELENFRDYHARATEIQEAHRHSRVGVPVG